MRKRIISILRKDNSVVLFGNLAASAFGVITFMILARTLTKSEFGDWALFISAVGLLDLMKTGLVRQALVRAISIEPNPEKHQNILASATVITLLSSVVLAGIIASINPFLGDIPLKSFFIYYPLITLTSSLHNFDTWKSHAMEKFGRMNSLRLFVNVLFVIVVVSGLFIKIPFDGYFISYVGVQALVSIYSYFTSIKYIQFKKASLFQIKELLKFGKHSVATLTGTNLLKSADSLLIGLFLGKEAVAIYAIPLKVLDLVEIPLRGFVMTAFGKLSKLHAEGNEILFIKLFNKNLKSLTAVILPVAAVMLIYPGLFIEILGGANYEESNLLLQIFLLPLILLPLDKFIGISLDAVNMPKVNAVKVWVMAITNILGDLLAIHFLGTLWSVAAVTIFTSTAGILFGLSNHPYLGRKTVRRKPSMA